MSETATRMTAEEFLAWDAPEARVAQLIDGEVVVCFPKPMHQIIELRLAIAISNWIDAGKRRGLVLTTTGLPRDERNVFAPDVLWFVEENRPTDLYAYPVHADLCVEIRSASTWRYDVGAKRAVYERTGLPELWLVDDRTEVVTALRRSSAGAPSFDIAVERRSGDSLSSPQLPGFAFDVDELFRR